ncbi:hypothetical protein GEZ93_03055 [Streptococcus mitis]|uniref:Uncharacterized protein n=1 Tax=Streptococcus mitis TaxID=28037 RepID=A0A6I1UCL8_STRMT|nr:hypothetical protein [Streptococcus mitis]MQQ40453.1 hypothetical protein [Streptococcus mitis]
MSCFVAFHYRSYGTFFLQQNRLHNIHRGFTHYKYYRALFFYNKIGSIISIGDLPTTNIIEPQNKIE